MRRICPRIQMSGVPRAAAVVRIVFFLIHSWHADADMVSHAKRCGDILGEAGSWLERFDCRIAPQRQVKVWDFTAKSRRPGWTRCASTR